MKLKLLLVIFAIALSSCSEDSGPDKNINAMWDVSAEITLLELGSVSCTPCQMMRPVLDSIASKYNRKQLEVVIVDIIKDPQTGQKFDVKYMPTQVFLDSDGIEFHRHVGYYPQAQIDSVLQEKLRG